MIKQLNIKNLFGRFSYDIITKSDGVTIITGPNGYGKSTILKIIYALSVGNIGYFVQLDFTSICITFDNGESIEMKKDNNVIYLNGTKIKFSSDCYRPAILSSRRHCIMSHRQG